MRAPRALPRGRLDAQTGTPIHGRVLSVSDITHDVVDDGFHEIHLSGKQLVFLFMATMVVSVVIFLMGVFVGRNVRAQQTVDQLTDPTAAMVRAVSEDNPALVPVPIAFSREGLRVAEAG